MTAMQRIIWKTELPNAIHDDDDDGAGLALSKRPKRKVLQIHLHTWA